MKAPTSAYGCGAYGNCVACYGDAEWQIANFESQLSSATDDEEIVDLELLIEMAKGRLRG